MYLHAGCSCQKHEAQKELEPHCPPWSCIEKSGEWCDDFALFNCCFLFRCVCPSCSNKAYTSGARLLNSLVMVEKENSPYTLVYLVHWEPGHSNLSIWWLRAGGGRNCRVPTAARYSNSWTCHSSSWICAAWHSSWGTLASNCCTFIQSSWFFCCSAASSHVHHCMCGHVHQPCKYLPGHLNMGKLGKKLNSLWAAVALWVAVAYCLVGRTADKCGFWFASYMYIGV